MQAIYGRREHRAAVWAARRAAARAVLVDAAIAALLIGSLWLAGILGGGR